MSFDGQVLDDQPGLAIYDDPGRTRFAKAATGRAIIGHPLDRFLTTVQKSLAAAERLSDKTLLALEVYSASKFEQSLRARFLALVTAVEILSERVSRSEVASALIDGFERSINEADLEDREADQLRGAVRDLRTESIGSACRRLITDHLGSDAALEFSKWYKARSQLIHTGRTTLDLPATIDRIDRLVSQLLAAVAGVAT